MERDALGFYPLTVYAVTREEQTRIKLYYNGEVFTRREHVDGSDYVYYVQLTERKLKEVNEILGIEPVKQ